MCVSAPLCVRVCVCFLGVSDTFCSAAACQMSRLQILWQIGMLKLWFQPGYINPNTSPTSTRCTTSCKKKKNQQKPFKMLSKGIIACPRSAQDLSPASPSSPGGELRELQEEVRWCFSVQIYCTFKSIHMCLRNRTDKDASVYSWIPAREAVWCGFKWLWRSRFEVRLIHQGWRSPADTNWMSQLVIILMEVRNERVFFLPAPTRIKMYNLITHSFQVFFRFLGDLLGVKMKKQVVLLDV